jgi:hypothetical protein
MIPVPLLTGRRTRAFTPSSIANLYYCNVNTASLWSDAGITQIGRAHV